MSTEDLFSSITGFDDLAADDDLSFDDVDDETGSSAGDGKRAGRKNKLRSSSTAEKKATHNAVERARRESLNARFLVLADMLPGMTHVKRASKAAIVNKSIEFIRDMHRSESKLAKENDALKVELEALRQRLAGSGGGAHQAPGGNPAAALGLHHHHQQQQQQQHPGAGLPAHPHHHLFPGMHPMHMQLPMMPHFPAAMASVAASAAAHNPMLGPSHPASSPETGNKQQQQQQQQQQPAPPSAGLPAPSNAELGQHLFPGIFAGLFNNSAGGVFDGIDHVRSESGSPAGSSSATMQQQQQSQTDSRGGNGQFTYGLFELPSVTGFGAAGAAKPPTSASPASYNSPPGTVASLAGSERTSQSQQSSSSQLTSNTAPSPASSNGVPTPPNNAYSPLSQPPVSAAANDPAIAAFDGSADAAYLAAQFAPNDLAKAQHELQAFIAYQQRMAYAGAAAAGAAQQHPSPPQGSPLLFPAHGSFGYSHQQQHGAPHPPQQPQPQMPFAVGCGPSAQASMAGMPAWQMMMAQQQAMVAAYGQQGHF
jgi:hypothetical protein